jgi:2-iminobutanoate/2-iminopropanoate deaminase
VIREPVTSVHAPAAIGPYSQAIRTDTLVFASGQLGLDPATGQLRNGVEEQARQAFANLDAVLSAAGSGLGRVVKTTLYLVDMNDFRAVNAIYGQVFAAPPPARSTIQVAALPLGALVEIEAIALSA